ncbi:MAG: hypothetical protein U0Q07_05245 [Acidimicrobiales bacterium]
MTDLSGSGGFGLPGDLASDPMPALASDLGLRYVGVPNRGYREDVVEPIAWDLPLLQQGEPDDLRDLMYGEFAGLPVQVFDLALVSYREDPAHAYRSCVLFTLPADFPVLAVGPHTRLSAVQSGDRSAFGQRFRVLGRDPAVVDLVLTDDVRSWITTFDLPLSVELGGSTLLGHLPRLDPQGYLTLISILFGVYLRIPDGAWDRYGR